jgi:hypothetical protein
MPASSRRERRNRACAAALVLSPRRKIGDGGLIRPALFGARAFLKLFLGTHADGHTARLSFSKGVVASRKARRAAGIP